jgi:hypothetical protein
MHSLHISPHPPAYRFPVLADQKLGTLTAPEHCTVPEIYLRSAAQILTEYDLALPEPDQLNIIVKSALAVQFLFFTASLHRPETTEMHRVFAAFVLNCVTSAQETETP